MVPQNPIAAAAQGDLLAVIFTVIVFGAAATTMSEEKRQPLVSLGQAVNDVSLAVIQFLMRLAPVAVGILIAATVLRSGIDLLWSLAGYATVVIAGSRSMLPWCCCRFFSLAPGLASSRSCRRSAT